MSHAGEARSVTRTNLNPQVLPGVSRAKGLFLAAAGAYVFIRNRFERPAGSEPVAPPAPAPDIRAPMVLAPLVDVNATRG
jgi:hypothetical protein